MQNKKLVVASGNLGKIREIKQILPICDVIGYKDLVGELDIRESGHTFYENALIKVMAVYNKIGYPVLADDSGLMVDALMGAPGVYSARYAGDGIDAHNIEKLLTVLGDNVNRTAKFVCCVVYYDGSKIITETGETYGKILYQKTGSNGFGYDAVFFSNDLKKSFGEATENEKNSVSHRARALEKIKHSIECFIQTGNC